MVALAVAFLPKMLPLHHLFSHLEPASSFTQSVWDAVVGLGALEHDMFESLVAALSFLFFIVLFKLCAWLPLQRFDNVSRREKMQKTPLVSSFGIYCLNDFVCASSFPVYLVSIHVWHSFYPKRHVPNENLAPSTSRLLLELTSGIVLYDAIFFFVHLAMHQNRFLFRNVHYRHHSHRWLSPGATVVHSLADGSLQVIVNMLVQQISPWGIGMKHPASRILHNVIVPFMLVESHSEFDSKFSLHNFAPSIFAGSLRHRYHHACGGGSKPVFLQQFFKYLDDYFGFTVSDEDCRKLGLGESRKRKRKLHVKSFMASSKYQYQE